MFVGRKETGKPGEFDDLTIEGKRERLFGIARQFGIGFISEDGRHRFGDATASKPATPLSAQLPTGVGHE